MIKTRDDIKRLGTILGVWAHPDDETFSMAGIMAAAVANGQRVILITATRGEAGVQDDSRWPAKYLAQIRTHESKASLDILGGVQNRWLDYPDGGCADIEPSEPISRIAYHIGLHNPDTILTFGPDGMTGHPDHQTVSQWAAAAVERANSQAKLYHAIQTKEQYEAIQDADRQFNIFFNIDTPDICEQGDCAIYFELDDDLYTKKLAALRAMTSQQEGMMNVFGDSLRECLGCEAFTEPRS